MKIRESILGLACGLILASSIATMTGCDGADEATEPATSAETIRSANVALTLQDESGARIGEGSGILIAPRLVLTAAHLVSGKTRWAVRTADGKTATGVRGVTYDWLVYNSSKSHPRKNDVAVIYLDRPIRLDAYPKVSSTPLPAGATGTRIQGSGTTFTNRPGAFARLRTFPNSYVTELHKGEALDTGGALLDPQNRIVGVVTGQGMTTGKLYVARVDGVSAWIQTQTNNCDSGKDDPLKDPIVVKTYTPPSSSSSTSSGGTTSSSGATSSGSTTSSGSISSSSGATSSSGTTSTSSGSTSSGSTTSSSGTPSSCEDQTSGHCYGQCSTSSSSSSSSTSSSGSSGSNPITWPPTTTSSSGVTSSSTSSSGTTSSSSGEIEGNPCTDPNDDPEACPRDPDGCEGPTCGGGVPDDNMNYGACACDGKPRDGYIDVR